MNRALNDDITTFRAMPQEPCHDCKKLGCTVFHRGSMNPDNKVHKFCGACWEYRQQHFRKYGRALDLGLGLTKV